MIRGVKKGTKYEMKDKQRTCVTCKKTFICRGMAKYCWEHKKI